MAISDYILCCKCDIKLIYDGGKDNNREWWEERWGKEPEIMCPDCEKKLEPVAHCTLEQLVLLQRVVPSTGTIALYTAPPQREWVGLTEDQFLEASRLAEDGNYMVAFQRIQQWLKEKNHG